MPEEAATIEPRPQRRTRAHWLVTAGITAGLVALPVWRYYAVRESTDDAQVDGHIVSVAARVGGTVAAVKVDDNQYVEAGAVLAQIDPKDYEIALERARADMAEAEAAAQAARTGVPVATATTSSQVQTSESDLATARARLGSARARLREAQARNAQASQDLERFKRLVAKDEVSKQEYDAAVVAAEAAHASVEAAEAVVKEAEEGGAAAEARLTQARTGPQQVAIMRARAASAEARLQQARVAVERAQLDLAYTAVKAPATGVLSRKTLEVGQVVQPGQPLLALVPLEDIWVTANFKEAQLQNIRPGQSVTIAVDAYGSRSYKGRVDSVAPATGARFSLLPPENATGNYVKVVQRVPVKILFEKGQDPEHLLRPGMSVVPTVLTR